MKRKRRSHTAARFAALTAALLLLLATAIPAFAAESDGPPLTEAVTEEESGVAATPPVSTPVTPGDGDEVSTEPGTSGEEHSTAVGTDQEAESNAEYTPISRTVAGFLGDNAAELISGATLMLGLVLTLLVKKRLLPSLLDALGGILGKSREAVDSITAEHEKEREELTRILDSAEQLLARTQEAAAKAEEAADTVRTARAEGSSLRCVLAEQSALLYELLMSANLPQYQKERIGAAHAAAEQALTEAAHD